MSHSPAHRRGMVFVDDDHGEYDYQHHSTGDDSEDSDYAEITSDDSSSFHSEGEEIAEYWDPYCELKQVASKITPCIVVLKLQEIHALHR